MCLWYNITMSNISAPPPISDVDMLLILTGTIHVLFVDDVFGRVWEEDSIVRCAEVHPDKVGRGPSDGKDDVLLRRQVEGDPSHRQLAGEEQELPHGWRQETI